MFNFMSTIFPNVDCGTPGCALGWIGFHLELEHHLSEISVPPALGLPSFENHGQLVFYDRLVALSGSHDWKYHHVTCAKTLRQYADKYHPIKHQRFHQALIPADSAYEWNKVTV